MTLSRTFLPIWWCFEGLFDIFRAEDHRPAGAAGLPGHPLSPIISKECRTKHPRPGYGRPDLVASGGMARDAPIAEQGPRVGDGTGPVRYHVLFARSPCNLMRDLDAVPFSARRPRPGHRRDRLGGRPVS